MFSSCFCVHADQGVAAAIHVEQCNVNRGYGENERTPVNEARLFRPGDRWIKRLLKQNHTKSKSERGCSLLRSTFSSVLVKTFGGSHESPLCRRVTPGRGELAQAMGRPSQWKSHRYRNRSLPVAQGVVKT